MDGFKKKRAPLRSQWTRAMKKIEDLMIADPLDLEAVIGSFKRAESVALEVEELSRKIVDLMVDDNAPEKDLDEEMDKSEDYSSAFCILRERVEKLMRKAEPPRQGGSDGQSFVTGVTGGCHGGNRAYHLPKMKIKEFSGEFKEWLGWWAQFQRIHNDPSLDTSIKFQFLDMAIVKGSKARAVIDVFPMSDENYPKAIEALQYRFGRNELQVEVYVRELIKLLILNVNQKEKLEVSKLYDQFGSHLKALESFGVTAQKNDAILFPLMESCLPVGVLRAWERSDLSKKDGSKEVPPVAKLEYLMEFLKGEVESEQRISLAIEGFGTKEAKSEPVTKGKFQEKVRKTEERQPTAAGLVNEVNRPSCIFCSGTHYSECCGKAHNLTLAKRKDQIVKSGRCLKCIRKGCPTNACRSSVFCLVCGGGHHTLVCPGITQENKQPEKRKQNSEPDGEKSIDPGTPTASNANIASAEEVYLQTAMIEIINGNKKKVIRALFDTGSQRTHIKTSTAVELGLEVEGTETLEHVLFGGVRTTIKHNKFQVKIKTKEAPYQFTMNVLDQDEICDKLPSVYRGPWMAQLREKGIWLDDIAKGDCEIEMLIGGKEYGKLQTGKVEQLPSGLTAVDTKVGWTVMGSFTGSKGGSKDNHSMVVTSLTVSQMSVPDLWRLETIGILDPIDVKTQQEAEAEVLNRFEGTVKQKENGRYVVQLPWRCENPDLPNNRKVAEKRLQSATEKLKRADRSEEGKDMFSKYDDIFKEWIQEEIIEEIPDDGIEKCHYLPHRAVVKEESATTKIRPVFDASCKTGRAPSLNDCLEKGPNLVDLIPSVMLRFRTGSIGVISDIRKAFLMIEVVEADRNYLRFLWWEGPQFTKIKVFRHKRVVFGVNSSPFLLGAVIKHHLARYIGDWGDVAEKISKSLYVDNCVASVDSEQELRRFREISIKMMEEAGMDLRLWQDSLTVTDDMEERVVPVLGMRWDRFADELYCEVPSDDLTPKEVTKRKILSLTQQIFDPLGIICPVTVLPKLLLQETWATKKGWDEQVEDEVENRFLKWTKDLPQLASIRVPRCFRGGNQDKTGWSLHCFTDASSYGYGAVVFLRCEGNPVTVQLLQAKARVAPMKKSTINRLELLGGVIGARLLSSVASALGLEEVPQYLWCDSSTVLSWIRKNDDWGTFVGNRVREILKISSANQWRHIPGKMNPADLPSRGCTASELLASKWWEGPDWLKSAPEDWPKEDLQVDEESVNLEKKKGVVSGVTTTTNPGKQWFLEGHSGYEKMLRRSSYVFRVADRIAKRDFFVGKEVSPEERDATEKKLVSVVQKEAFGEVKTPRNLQVFKDQEGILRVKTKLLRRQDTQDFKTPMLLPTRHPFVTRLIWEAHIDNSHAGTQALMSILREKFWIFHTRTAITDVIRGCQACRRQKAKNVEEESATLPEDRIRNANPFEFSGVDLAGPLYLRGGRKAWIVLFTCAVYRGVHLELVTSLGTDKFLGALRRFVRRCGRPKRMYSDNGTNFRGAVNLFQKLDWGKIKKEQGLTQIEWRFSPPSAPWWGGFWERMVRNVKELLVRVLGRASVDYEDMTTILTDVEAVVNQRPLTVMTEDGDDLVALTPEMFMRGVRESGVAEIDEIDREGLNNRYQYRQGLMDQLRSRFRTEYLASLVDKAKQKPTYELRAKDLVLIGEDNKKRLQWQLGMVESFLGKRVALVRVPGGGIFTRPVRRLYPMELSAGDDADERTAEVITRRGRVIRKPARFQ